MCAPLLRSSIRMVIVGFLNSTDKKEKSFRNSGFFFIFTIQFNVFTSQLIDEKKGNVLSKNFLPPFLPIV